MRILKSLDLNTFRSRSRETFTRKFQNPEFKPIIKNLQEKLHQV